MPGMVERFWGFTKQHPWLVGGGVAAGALIIWWLASGEEETTGGALTYPGLDPQLLAAQAGLATAAQQSQAAIAMAQIQAQTALADIEAKRQIGLGALEADEKKAEILANLDLQKALAALSGQKYLADIELKLAHETTSQAISLAEIKKTENIRLAEIAAEAEKLKLQQAGKLAELQAKFGLFGSIAQMLGGGGKGKKTAPGETFQWESTLGALEFLHHIGLAEMPKNFQISWAPGQRRYIIEWLPGMDAQLHNDYWDEWFPRLQPPQPKPRPKPKK